MSCTEESKKNTRQRGKIILCRNYQKLTPYNSYLVPEASSLALPRGESTGQEHLRNNMPELPEIETIRLGLSKKIVGLTIKKVDVLSPKTFQGKVEEVEGRKVVEVWRRAKILGIDLSGKTTLLFHLKMSGQLVWTRTQNKELRTKNRFIGGHPTVDMAGPMPNSHTRVIFIFDNDSKLYFNDQRRFGWIKVVQSSEFKVQSFFKELGPEPLDKSFTWQVLKQNLLKRKSMAVKVAIMDQKVVSGVGNIYANEACFDAKIDPRTKVKDLTDKDFKSLHRGVTKSLRDGIKYGGSTRAHFVNAEGQKGYFLDYAFVYGKDKEKCRKCSSIIQKIQLDGRGTYFCAKCQH